MCRAFSIKKKEDTFLCRRILKDNIDKILLRGWEATGRITRATGKGWSICFLFVLGESRYLILIHPDSCGDK